MIWLLVAVAVLLVNGAVGAAVWTWLDNDGRLFEWYVRARKELGPTGGAIVQFLILQWWPVGWWVVSRRRREAQAGKEG